MCTKHSKPDLYSSLVGMVAAPGAQKMKDLVEKKNPAVMSRWFPSGRKVFNDRTGVNALQSEGKTLPPGDTDEHCDERSQVDFQETYGGYLRVGVWHILVTGKKKEMSRILTSTMIFCKHWLSIMYEMTLRSLPDQRIGSCQSAKLHVQLAPK